MNITNSPTFFVEAFQKQSTTIAAIVAAFVGRDADTLTSLENVVLSVLIKDNLVRIDDKFGAEIVRV